MGLQIKKTSVKSAIPIWQTGRSPETAQGGFVLEHRRNDGEIVPGGSLVVYDETTRKAAEVVSASLTENATNIATSYKVKKGAGFKVGDPIAAAIGGTPQTITVIDVADSNFDKLTVGTTLGVDLAAGKTIFKVESDGSLPGDKFGLLYEDTVITGADSTDVAVVLRGTVYENRIPALGDDAKALLPATVLFSKSF